MGGSGGGGDMKPTGRRSVPPGSQKVDPEWGGRRSGKAPWKISLGPQNPKKALVASSEDPRPHKTPPPRLHLFLFVHHLLLRFYHISSTGSWKSAVSMSSVMPAKGGGPRRRLRGRLSVTFIHLFPVIMLHLVLTHLVKLPFFQMKSGEFDKKKFKKRDDTSHYSSSVLLTRRFTELHSDQNPPWWLSSSPQAPAGRQQGVTRLTHLLWRICASEILRWFMYLIST